MDTDEGGVGDQFGKEIEPVASMVPYMYSFGNHDFDSKNQTNYRERFRMPSRQANQGTNLFYSFNLGQVHFISVNTAMLGHHVTDDTRTQMLTQRN